MTNKEAKLMSDLMDEIEENSLEDSYYRETGDAIDNATFIRDIARQVEAGELDEIEVERWLDDSSFVD